MKFPIIVEKKKDKYGENGYSAFCPLFHDARTFSPCDDRRDAIDEVQEIIEDEVDELIDDKEPLPKVPKMDDLKKKYPNAKIVWVSVDVDSDDENEFEYSEENDEADEDDETDDFDEDDEDADEDDYDEEMDDLLDDDDD